MGYLKKCIEAYGLNAHEELKNQMAILALKRYPK